MKRVPMKVPVNFRRVIRKKAGEQDTSMFKYLDDLADEMNGFSKDEKKKFKFKW